MANMPKYKVEHYEQKIRRHFDPLIKEQELLVKQFEADATKKIVDKLAKRMGADKIINQMRTAEERMKIAKRDARIFFTKKAEKEKKEQALAYNMKHRENEINLEDCVKTMEDWAKELVDREIRKRPEGKQLAQLEAVKQKSMDIVYENGDDEAIAKALDNCTKKIGIAWVVDTSNIKQISSK
jgi:capsule polysaccharide export protein KpsE/RkpR